MLQTPQSHCGLLSVDWNPVSVCVFAPTNTAKELFIRTEDFRMI